LILGGPLFLHIAEEIAARTFRFADFVQVQGDGDAALRDEADDAVIG
jgi:hypothetical protein